MSASGSASPSSLVGRTRKMLRLSYECVRCLALNIGMSSSRNIELVQSYGARSCS